MAINLSNVNVSIQQFQAVASGEVNAGEVKLTSETTLGKVNNFVSRKWKNKTDHTHEEVLAVKSAFIRALNSCGVVGDELARVRARLGLAPEPGDAVDHTLGARSITPLTRQEVREILDRYPDFQVRLKHSGIFRVWGQRSSLHLCFRRVSEAA